MTTVQPKISVIVPVYKVEPYLRRCIDSILAQTYTNIELILVMMAVPIVAAPFVMNTRRRISGSL